MTKIAIICDTHFGVRGDSSIFLEHQKKFFDNIFFPTIKSRNIETILHLGDLVDRRKFINFNTLSMMKESFLDKITTQKMVIIAGNHDVFYKSSNKINALDNLLKEYNFEICIDPVEIKIDGIELLLLPWINQENIDESFNLIKTTQSQLCFGHLEIAGFEMYKGSVCEHGLNRKDFSKFDQVFSGHFHHKSNNDNIHYLGAPYEMTWADNGFERGFHIFDLKTRKLEFIKNPYSLFNRIEYNDENNTFEDLISNIDKSSIKDSFVKIDVIKKTNPYTFDMVIDKIESYEPYDLKINDYVELSYEVEEKTEIEDTKTLIVKNIDRLDINVDKPKLKMLISDLYNQALDTQINN